MGFFDKLWGRRPAPPPPVPVPIPPLVPRIAPAPVKVQPLPVFPDDPETAEVARLWTEFQRVHANPTWDHFITSLAATNSDLLIQIDKIQRELATHPPRLVR